MDETRLNMRTMKITDAKNQLSRLVNEIHRHETRVLIEKSGIPVAALISVDDLNRLLRFEQQRAERFKVIAEMREAFKDVPVEEIEREADRAVAELREKAAAIA